MTTLLLRLSAPLQSWGIDSKFDIRKTEREPSKSGVIGLLAAALGRGRDESVDDLTALRFGVRVDREGTIQKDFHMVKAEKASYVTNRYYLADAVFLAGLASDDRELLSALDAALRSPAFPLFLGRRSCPATLPLTLGLRETDLPTALRQEPPLAGPRPSARILMDAAEGDRVSGRVHDVPLSFSPYGRSYGWRAVCHETVVFEGAEEHDPMEELR